MSEMVWSHNIWPSWPLMKFLVIYIIINEKFFDNSGELPFSYLFKQEFTCAVGLFHIMRTPYGFSLIIPLMKFLGYVYFATEVGIEINWNGYRMAISPNMFGSWSKTEWNLNTIWVQGLDFTGLAQFPFYLTIGMRTGFPLTKWLECKLLFPTFIP